MSPMCTKVDIKKVLKKLSRTPADVVVDDFGGPSEPHDQQSDIRTTPENVSSVVCVVLFALFKPLQSTTKVTYSRTGLLGEEKNLSHSPSLPLSLPYTCCPPPSPQSPFLVALLVLSCTRCTKLNFTPDKK